MFVRRLRLYGVKPLRRDIPDGEGHLPEATRWRLLLQGGNGSGKTTILETIQTLWEFFGQWIDHGTGKPSSVQPIQQMRHYLAEAELAAIELGDFPAVGQTFWLGVGEANAWEDLKRAHPEAAFAGLIRYGRADRHTRVELPARDWKTFRDRSIVGSEPQPNIVYFPPENRTVASSASASPKLVNTLPMNWCSVYSPELDIGSLLLTVKALRIEDFQQSLSLVNLALNHRNKKLVDFGPAGRLSVEGRTAFDTSYEHPPEKLSSGERQMLLLIAHTVAFLRPGGIVLIDEPDLHIHISMITQLMETLEKVVRERNGQLIVASHSEWVWNWFSRDEERIELTPWRGGNT
jgi:energy-coupling factor transporter ATP-binding protein EcfA2